MNGGVSGGKLLSSDIDNLKIKVIYQTGTLYFFASQFISLFYLIILQKVLSNSEDLKIKNWLIEETNNEEMEDNMDQVNV